MIFKTMDASLLTIEQTRKYYPMLSEQRKKKINDTQSPEERSVLFCSEILARQCLSELFDAPEFSFQLLCNPDGKSLVGNYSANLSISSSGSVVGCVAGIENVGICVRGFEPFAFSDAQKLFTDSEMRAVYSGSRYSFAELINMSACNEESVMKMYALFFALKEAYFNATGRGVRSHLNKIKFAYTGDNFICSDGDYKVVYAAIENDKKAAVAVVERIKNEQISDRQE